MKKFLALTLTLGSLTTFAADSQGRCASSGTSRHNVNSFVYQLDKTNQTLSLDGYDLEMNKVNDEPIIVDLNDVNNLQIRNMQDQDSGEEFLSIVYEAKTPRGKYKNFAFICTKE